MRIDHIWPPTTESLGVINPLRVVHTAIVTINLMPTMTKTTMVIPMTKMTVVTQTMMAPSPEAFTWTTLETIIPRMKRAPEEVFRLPIWSRLTRTVRGRPSSPPVPSLILTSWLHQATGVHLHPSPMIHPLQSTQESRRLSYPTSTASSHQLALRSV